MSEARNAVLPRAAGEGNRAQRGGGGHALHRPLCRVYRCTAQLTGVVGDRLGRSPSTALRAVPLPREAGEDGRRRSIAGARRP
jgi:hypothetical protein